MLSIIYFQDNHEFQTKVGYSWSVAAGVMSLLRGRKSLQEFKGLALKKEACSCIQRWWRDRIRNQKLYEMKYGPPPKTKEEIKLEAIEQLQQWYRALCRKWGFESGLPPSSTVMSSSSSSGLLKASTTSGGGILGLIRRAKARQLTLNKQKSKRVIDNGLRPLRRNVSQKWLTCRQVAYLMSCFPANLPPYCRVRVLQICFSRIIDLENLFTHIMNYILPQTKQRLLSRTVANIDSGGKVTREIMFVSDYEEAITRLGWLNIFNPNDPDLIYDLDHSKRDHYQLSLMLVELADIEPGENFVGETWTKYDKQTVNKVTGEKGAYVLVPGWELPVSWLSPGPPEQGYLHVEYYSGRDPTQVKGTTLVKGQLEDHRGPLAGLEGCNPIWDLRSRMLENVLLGNQK